MGSSLWERVWIICSADMAHTLEFVLHVVRCFFSDLMIYFPSLGKFHEGSREVYFLCYRKR